MLLNLIVILILHLAAYQQVTLTCTEYCDVLRLGTYRLNPSSGFHCGVCAHPWNNRRPPQPGDTWYLITSNRRSQPSSDTPITLNVFAWNQTWVPASISAVLTIDTIHYTLPLSGPPDIGRCIYTATLPPGSHFISLSTDHTTIHDVYVNDRIIDFEAGLMLDCR